MLLLELAPAPVQYPETASPAPTPPPTRKRPPHTPKRGSKRLVQGTPWRAPDTPLFPLRDGWHLATDRELQWIVYRRRGSRWVAFGFPTSKAAVWMYLREYVSDRFGTLEGVDPAAVSVIRSWPGHLFRHWLEQQTTTQKEARKMKR